MVEKQQEMSLDTFVNSSRILERYAWNVISNMSTFTADDLHVLEKEIERCKRDRRVIGAILKRFERLGLIRKLGYVSSKRRECHGRPVLRWEVL